MQPILFPPGGTPLPSGSATTLRLLSKLASEVGAQAAVEVAGNLGVDTGSTGHTLVAQPAPQIQCFEIMRDEWCNINPPPHNGASLGNFFYTFARPVLYIWHSNLDTCWSCDQNEDTANDTRIFWASSGSGTPTATLGDWVWCIWDVEASVWRVMTTSTATTAAPVTDRYGLLRSDLNEGGTCTIEEMTWVDGVLTLTGVMYTASDPLGEFRGTADVSCCTWWIDPNRGSAIASIRRMSCPNFQGCPCTTPVT